MNHLIILHKALEKIYAPLRFVWKKHIKYKFSRAANVPEMVKRMHLYLMRTYPKRYILHWKYFTENVSMDKKRGVDTGSRIHNTPGSLCQLLLRLFKGSISLKPPKIPLSDVRCFLSKRKSNPNVRYIFVSLN